MKLSEACIQRPVFSWVMTLILILVGIVGGSRLPLQQYPKIERPYVTVESSLPGAAPEIVEAQITRVIEEALAGIEGIASMSSTSSVEDSKVVIEFNPERKIEDASNDIRDRLNKAKDRLPREMTDPILTKSKAEERAIITLALTSDTLEPSTLADYALRELQKDLESLKGVARVDVLGAGLYKMHIKLNPIKLAAYRITVSDVMQALKQQNIEKPAGKLISKEREYLVTTIASLSTPEEFNILPIATRDGHLVKLQDIGNAEVSADDKRTRTRFNGKPGVSLGVVKQSTSNPIEVAREVKKLLPTLQERLPAEMSIHIGSDRTIFIERSLERVYQTIFEAIFLVILVVFAFLRSARASLIPLVTIPVSLIGALFLMYLLDFSINTLTLMAMVLAIGLVVDDAIVVLENIHRYLEEGLSPVKAAVKGIREISFAIIAMTLTLAAVYAPIALSTGTTGKFFTEFALTLAGAVFISGFAALTLSPMMCARLLTTEHQGEEAAPHHWWNKLKSKFRSDLWLDQLEKEYERVLTDLLKKPSKLILTGIAFAALGFVVFLSLPRELFPKEDQGSIFLEGQANQSSTLEHTDKYVAQLDTILGQIPDVERRVTQVNNPTFDASIQLKSNRSLSTDEIEKEISQKLLTITGLEARVSSGATSERSNVVEFVVQGNKSYREIKEIAQKINVDLYGSKIVEAVLANIHGDTEDFVVDLNRAVAASLNIAPVDVADTIDTLIRGRKATSFKKENKLYDVMVEVEDVARQTPYDITNLFMKAGDKEGTLVPISELVTVHSRSGPKEIYRYNRMRSVSFTAKLKSGVGLGEAVQAIKEIGRKNLPKDIRIDFTGETRRFLTETQNILVIFGLALCFIYLIMAAQFESWIDPFIIMLSVPLSLAGAVITLALVNGLTLNLYSQIGLVTLIGLITKHGILMVDFANKLRDEGLTKVQAIIQASRKRLRPILMTTFAMVLGTLPLAFAIGEGAERNKQIGWVIVGGMTIGTIFTLFVLPAIYYYMAQKRKPLVDINVD